MNINNLGIDSPLKWIGGKKLLRNEIISRFCPHECYIEVFSGALWVYFYKNPSKVEIINDLNGELINFYKVLQSNPEGFKKGIKYLLSSREMFNSFRNIDIRKVSSLARAVRFYYLIHFSYNAMSQYWNTSVVRGVNVNVWDNNSIDDITRRLRGTHIEQMDAIKLIERYDRDFVLSYIDPPYYGLNYYDKSGAGTHESNFTERDHERLADTLRNCQMKWILSINDEPEIREMYKGFNIEIVSFHYSSKSNMGLDKEDTICNELIIRNYEGRTMLR